MSVYLQHCEAKLWVQERIKKYLHCGMNMMRLCGEKLTEDKIKSTVLQSGSERRDTRGFSQLNRTLRHESQELPRLDGRDRATTRRPGQDVYGGGRNGGGGLVDAATETVQGQSRSRPRAGFARIPQNP